MQDVLVHVRKLDAATPAARFGIHLAAKLAVPVTGVYVCPAPIYLAPAYQPEVVAATVAEAREATALALRSQPTFAAWAAAQGVQRTRWLVAQGQAVNALAQAAAYHDVLVLDHADTDAGAAWDLPGVIIRSGVPCFVMPPSGTVGETFQRVAIAWNGSPEATRAVHAALPFMQGASVLLLSGIERPPFAEVDWQPPFNICEYLRRHGIMAEVREIKAASDDIGAALLAEAAGFDADLLVMGAYGRTRFSEWMLGGATRHVLAWSPIPVLLRH